MKTVTIDELLTWAFVHELPKGGGVEGLVNPNSAWRMICELGTRVSSGHEGGPGGGENYFIEQGEPHDDALAVGEMVSDLRHCDVVFAPNWQPLADWPTHDHEYARLTRAAETRVRESFLGRGIEQRAAHILNLVVGQSILGGAPDCAAEPRKVKLVDRRGMPLWFVKKAIDDPTTGLPHEMEVDGFDQKKRRPVAGAYRKHEFSEDPRGDILGRLDYQIWVASLRYLHRLVGPMLAKHRLVQSDLSMTPWLSSDGRGVTLVARPVAKG